MNLEDKTVLVTGSTDGVGRLVARRLADQSARVLIHGAIATEASNYSTRSGPPAAAW
jgi:NAD(P)-dependent dehydrogenase (short-subunit alcohol dehydrogenase family)